MPEDYRKLGKLPPISVDLLSYQTNSGIPEPCTPSSRRPSLPQRLKLLIDLLRTFEADPGSDRWAALCHGYRFV
jgi:hypothetical protein